VLAPFAHLDIGLIELRIDRLGVNALRCRVLFLHGSAGRIAGDTRAGHFSLAENTELGRAVQRVALDRDLAGNFDSHRLLDVHDPLQPVLDGRARDVHVSHRAFNDAGEIIVQREDTQQHLLGRHRGDERHFPTADRAHRRVSS